MTTTLQQRTLVSGSAIYLISNLVNATIPFVLLPVLTRYIHPADYGKIAMFQTLISALGAFVGLGVSGAAGVKYYDGDLAEGELKSYIAVCIEILGVTVGVIFGFMFMFREHLSGWIGLPTKWILWAVLMSSASVVFQIRQIQWQVRKAARNYGVFQVAQSLFNMLLSLLFVVILLQGAEGRMAAQILAMGVFALLALVLLKRDDLLGGFVWQPSLVKEALRFGVPLIPHTAGGFLLTSVDRFVINAELGLVEAGVYMVAVQLTSAMTLIFDAINKAYVPWLFERLKRDHDAEKRQIVRYTYVWFAIILLGTGLAFVIGPWLVTLIAGEEYARAGDVIGWLALGQAFGGMYLMVTNYIFYSKRTGLLSLATVISGVINVVLLILFIRLIGLTGAAIAFSIAAAIRFLLTWWVSQKRHPMPWFNFNAQD